MIAELLMATLENFIYDITSSSMKNWLDKHRQKKFLKSIRKDIAEFCSRNQCLYLDSGAFEYFIRNTRFVERVIERAVSTKLNSSDKEFIKIEIKKAREIASNERISFSNNEERIVKDLYYVVDRKVGDYYRSKLSTEQRHIVAVCLESIVDLRKSVDEFKEKSLSNQDEIFNILKKENRLSDAKAEIIANLFFAELCNGRFQEFDDLAQVVKDKSDDLRIYYECLSQIICAENCTESINRIAEIRNIQVRDNAIRIAIPILLFRNESFEAFLEFVSAGSLKEIVTCLVNKEIEAVLIESITFEGGLEIHNFTINKKLSLEEEWLMKQIAVFLLYDKKIRNIYSAMEEVEKGNRTWLSEILVADRKMEKCFSGYASDDSIAGMQELQDSLKSQNALYDHLCGRMRAFYYSVLVKIYLLMNRLEDAEKIIPEEIKGYRPLSDYVLAIKSEKKEVGIEEIYNYSVKNDTYWLINNYFFARRNEAELISFCKDHEEVFENDRHLFFMYIRALKVTGQKEELVAILNQYAERLKYTYEYWNELLEIEHSEQVHRDFLDACREGKMTGMFVSSEHLIIERLLSCGEYEIAEIYLKKYEKTGEKDYRTNKYKAIIQQRKKNEVEAIKWYKAAFAENQKDVYVIDSLITLSLINKRTVDKRVIDAAKKADTSRLHMLVAAVYLSEGNATEAKNENIRSILMSEENYNPAFGQFLTIATRFESNDVIKINGIEGGTAAYCKNIDGKQCWLCVYKDNILPTSPHSWNNDYHVYIDDAAGLGFLRKHKGDHVVIEEVDFEVMDIIPIDAYFFRICTTKMTQKGLAKEILIPSKDGKMDISAFTEWIVQNTPDERNAIDWLKQYNNVRDVPMPLFVYKRFTRLSYLQFVDMILSSEDIFVREILQQSKQADKYIISFSALIALFKAGVPAESIVKAGGSIMESTLIQVESDVSEIIKEYDRETVASLGVVDRRVFINQVDDTGKDFWLKEAGLLKKYCEAIPTVNSENDLAGPFFGEFDSKELLGICDYDAISFVMQNNEYSLVTIEAMLYSMSFNEDVQLKVTSISDWLINRGFSAVDLLVFIKKLMDLGCLMSVTKDVISYLSKTVNDGDESIRERIYTDWNKLLSSIDNYPENHKMVAIQALSEVFILFVNEALSIDSGIRHILLNNILLLKKQKIEAFVDENGYLSFAVVNINPDEQVAEIKDE